MEQMDHLGLMEHPAAVAYLGKRYAKTSKVRVSFSKDGAFSSVYSTFR